jgi:MFS family permease
VTETTATAVQSPGDTLQGDGLRGRGRGFRGHGLGVVVYAAMVLFIVGSSAPVPLLPLYGERLDLTPDRVALVFSVYFATMVLALGLGSVPAAQARPRLSLGIALGLSVGSDALFLVGTEPSLVAARILTGFSVGIGIGAGATLAVMLRGERGRSIAATMTMVAGFVGVVGTALLADLTPWPTTAPFVVHGGAAFLVLALLWCVPAPGRAPAPAKASATEGAASVGIGVVGTEPGRAAGAAPPTASLTAVPSRTGVLVCAAVGILAWSLGNVVVGLAPTVVRVSIDTDSLLAASFVAMLVASCGMAAQYAMPLSRMRLSASVSGLFLAAGAACVVAGLALDQVAVILVGGALTGAGQGAGYRLGMLAVTRGLPPRRHGARTSLYAAMAYVSAAASVQMGGTLMTGFGHEGLQLFVTVLLVPILVLLGACSFGRWRPIAREP